jgi:hypothetical protein
MTDQEWFDALDAEAGEEPYDHSRAKGDVRNAYNGDE